MAVKITITEVLKTSAGTAFYLFVDGKYRQWFFVETGKTVPITFIY